MPPMKRLKNADPPITMPRGRVYLTDSHVEALGIEGDDKAVAQAIADAQAVYTYIDPNPWEVTEDVLAKFAEHEWGDEGPDRLRVALQVLVSSGRITSV